MEATFRLARQTAAKGWYAMVSVDVTPAPHHEVMPVARQAFVWRADVGIAPDAPQEAFDGAWYALERLPDGTPTVRVVITRIQEHPAHTGPGDIKYATAHAVWRALNVQPEQDPWVGETLEWIFP
ncbi:hypothetical protein Misp01_30140 [Microtetraspora sp. NBRC 13810]|uniref:hypothetical protein n=1 Tax=Microtetraspora sp. NBRC 13810 TaxID=3030990 RepID=UPI0024A36711|nr:hypothetical protein [Microtetraspora sp. NBRC 13810]GLW07884.1 hypothetical protein Misp01_30140 [Microtetraspora sp. NBRC 13810]